MKLITFLLTIIITANLYGQTNPEAAAKNDFKKIQIGVNFSPDYCFRTLQNNDGSASSDMIVKWRNDNETGKLSFTTGINMIFNLNKNIGIGAGIQYSNKGYQIKTDDLTYGSMIDPRRGFTNPSGAAITSAKFIYNDHYIDIPLKINLSFGKKKIRFVTSGGVATNIFITETSTMVLKYSDGTKDRDTQKTSYNYNKVNVSPFISAGIDWKFNDRNNLKIEPTIRYGVLKIIDAPVTGYLWNAGLNISYYFGLK
ncbi:MAG: outer membrane beta-barrel protein [Bacteroidota bacterium]